MRAIQPLSRLAHSSSTFLPVLASKGFQRTLTTSSKQPTGKLLGPYYKNEVTLPHPVHTKEYMDSIQITHKPVRSAVDALAFAAIKGIRIGFDLVSGYYFRQLKEPHWLTRIVFLETVAGVPGAVAANMRHFKSLRSMKEDRGWIHTLLEEAENERAHLLAALELKQPSTFFHGVVVLTQIVFRAFFTTSYIISPHFAHSLVGYLEEEAVVTYSKIIKQIDAGKLPEWKTQQATPWMIKYWSLKDDATIRDVMLAIRADEAHHRDVNHTLSSLAKTKDPNPFEPGH